MKQHKIFWGSSYDRSLDILLYMWPDILEEHQDAELHICYGWDLFDKVQHTNPERMQWKEKVESMMQQKGIHHYGRVSKDDLKKVREMCGIWAYPTYFPEINCITALDAQNDGLVPVTMDDFALSETVGSGVKVKGDIRTMKVQEEFKNELISLMGDTEQWKKESQKAQEFARGYTWDTIAESWDTVFHQPVVSITPSIITVTMRTGWWNIMAHNLSQQTHKDFEWIIVDDYKDDRSEIAKKYAKKYDLNIRYIRGDKCQKKYDRKYGLVRANNIGYREANGDLLIWLQDFILLQPNAIEKLIDLHRRNPNALLAPVDDYYHCIKPNRDNAEDWFDSDTDVITSHSWRNVRQTFSGLTPTENPYDYEMNFSATPKHILDDLQGWWEFYDDALGYDNTEIAYRALLKGYKILIDDTNVATCIDLRPHIEGEKENIEDRERKHALPQWLWFKEQMNKGTLPVTRDQKIDDSITLTFNVPKEIPDSEATQWILDNADTIAAQWENYG